MVDSGNSYPERVSRLVSWGHWFSFFNIILAMLIGVRFIAESAWPTTLLGQFYLFVSWIGHFGFLVFALYILILFPLTFVIPSRKLLRLLGVIFATLGLTLLLLDTQAYDKLHLHLNPVVWELLFSKEKSPINTQWQYLFAAVPIIFLIQLALSEWIWNKQRRLSQKKIGKPLTVIFFLCFLTSHFVYIWADAFFYKPITNQRANFPLSYPMTAKSFMEKHGLLDREEYERQLITNGGSAEVVNYPLEPLKFSGRGENYSVLMVMVSGLRADTLNAQVMPNSFEFAQHNQNFINHYSSSNNVYGVFGLFYGLPSSYASSIKAQNTTPLFLSSMYANNYQMGVFSSEEFADAEFYQQIFADLDIKAHHQSINSANTVENWQNWLTTLTSKPWFSYIDLGDVNRYEDVQQIAPQFNNQSNKAADKLLANYRSAAWSADQKIADIIATIEQRQEMDNTIIIITSDHGMEFNDNNNDSWGSDSNYSRYQLLVPMVIHWPNKAAAVYNHKTSHLDFSATMMKDLLHASSNPYDYSSGQSLFDVSSRRWILAGDSKKIALITDEHTTVVDEYGNYKMYDDNYQRDRDSKPKLSIVMQGLSELKRFYRKGD